MFPGSPPGLTLPQPFHYFHVSSDSTIAEPPFHMAIHSMLPCSPLWLALFHASEYSLPSPSMPLFHMAIAPMLLGIPLLLPLPKPFICLLFPCFRVFSPQPFYIAIVHMLLGILQWLALPNPSTWLLFPCFHEFPMPLAIPLWLVLPNPSIWLLFPCFWVFHYGWPSPNLPYGYCSHASRDSQFSWVFHYNHWTTGFQVFPIVLHVFKHNPEYHYMWRLSPDSGILGVPYTSACIPV